ncbi:hypothetical protein AVEN_6790-1 [Araneus ventricosus]|uniref:Uncharacterized protein n=1 Tax=Araneus ventricosus TaxID=182803 RepID=A0A4Y2M1N5_ARAVE|nr:hypothetical protein AVEN_6790-1 [Araneus ventricosus]
MVRIRTEPQRVRLNTMLRCINSGRRGKSVTNVHLDLIRRRINTRSCCSAAQGGVLRWPNSKAQRIFPIAPPIQVPAIISPRQATTFGSHQ